MPLINAEKVLQSIKSGQLEVLSGVKCSRYLGSGKGFMIDIQTRFGVEYGLKVSYLINSTGQGLDVTKYDARLIQNLLSHGVIVPHPSGGIQADFDTSAVIRKDGTPSSNLFAVGEITRGVHFFTNAISENTRNAGTIADCIVSRIDSDRSS